MSEELKNEGMVKTGAAEAAKAPAEATPATAETSDGLAALRNLLAEYKVDNIDAVMGNLQGLGVFNVDDLTILEDKDLREAGISLVAAKKMLAKLIGTMTRTVPTDDATVTQMNMMGRQIMPMSMIKLPEVPSEDSWLNGLKTDGVLKCNQMSYVSAVRAAIADRLDTKSLINRLCDKIKAYYTKNDQPVPQIYFDLLKQRARRGEYADIFAVIGGESVVLESDRKELIERMKRLVWPAAGECYRQLCIWTKLWNDSVNPGAALMAMSGYGNMLPPTMGAIPDAGAIRDAGDDLRNAINRALAGVGPAAAASIACDYLKVKKILNDESLAMHIGVADRAQMLKELGVDVSSSLIRMENNVVQFILGMATADTQTTADTEAGYFNMLYTLGGQIDWAQLGVSIGDANADTPRSFQGLTGRKLDTF